MLTIKNFYSIVQKEVDTQFSILERIKSRIETQFSIVASRFMSGYMIPARLIKPELAM